MAADDPVDIVDSGDRVIGRATRREVRAGNLLHRACYIVVLDGRGRVFVHLRTADKDVYPSHYDAVVGGILDCGESYDAGARREVGEEIGIAARDLRQVGFVRYEDGGVRVHGEVFECRATQPLRLQEEEVVSGEWLEAVEVERRIAEHPFCPDGVLAFRAWRAQSAAAERAAPADERS